MKKVFRKDPGEKENAEGTEQGSEEAGNTNGGAGTTEGEGNGNVDEQSEGGDQKG